MRALAALAALAVLVAGCTGTTEQPLVAAGASGPGPASPGAANNTTTGDGVNAATAWVRASWGDRTEAPLVAETVTLSNTVETPFSGCLLDCRFAFLVPAEGAFVAPGTDHVLFTATYTPPSTAPGLVLTLVYRTAADAEPTVLPAPSGEALRLPVGAQDADAPLAPRSQWWFFLNVQTDSPAHIPEFDAEVSAVAVRTGDVPVVPDAPDPWAGRASIALLQAYEAPMQGSSFTPVTGWSCFDCNAGWDSQGAGLVPPGAGELQATVAWDWATPSKPTLWAWNAVDQEGTVMALVQDGPTSRTFTLPVPPDQVDSPHQRRSHWGFFLTFDTQGQPVAAMHGRATVDVLVARAA